MLALRSSFEAGFESGLAGSPQQVTDSVRALGDYGIDRVTMVSLAPGTFELLAPVLLA
jgi:hypothetical protein